MPQVSVITVQPERTPIVAELPGRVDAVRDADPRTGDWHRPEDRLRAGRRRPGESSCSSRSIRRRTRPLRSSHRPAQAGAICSAPRCWPIATRRWSRPTRSASRNTTTPWRRTARPGCRGRRQGLRGQRLDQPRLHRRDLAHHRTHRQAAGHRGRAGRGHLTQMARCSSSTPSISTSTSPPRTWRRCVAPSPAASCSRSARTPPTVVLETFSIRTGKLLFTGITVDPTTGQVNLRAECRTRRTCCCRACMCA